jgi:hypothetical protein
MRKLKRLELWWQLYVTWLPVRDLENFRPLDFCWTEGTIGLQPCCVSRVCFEKFIIFATANNPQNTQAAVLTLSGKLRSWVTGVIAPRMSAIGRMGHSDTVSELYTSGRRCLWNKIQNLYYCIVCVYWCVSMWVCVGVWVCVCECVGVWVLVCVWACVCWCASVLVCVIACESVCECVCVCVWVCVRVCVSVCVCVCVCVCVWLR